MNTQNNAQLIKLAEHYFRSGNYSVAQKFLKQILDSNPADSKANELAAYMAGNTGNVELAHKLLQKASQQADCSPEALYYLGTSYLKNGQFEAAISSFERTLKTSGDFFEVLHNLGLAYFHVKKYVESIKVFKRAVLLRQNSFEALTNLGNSLKAIKENEEALVYQSQAVEANPQRPEGWLNKGVILNELKRYEDALTQYNQALLLKPDYTEAWSNKGNVLHTLKRFEEALAHHEQAVTLSNSDAETLFNKGITLHELKRYDEALEHLERAKQISPDLDFLLGTLVHEQMIVGKWDNFVSNTTQLSAALESRCKVASPFSVLSVIDSPHLHLLAAKNWVNGEYPANPALPSIPKYKNAKIRIGYFSADFRDHPVSALTAELFDLHDRNIFELFAFSLQGAPINDHMRERLSQTFDRFLDVQGMSDLDIARLARETQLDIAIDLGGHTKDARPGIFALRAAPIQVNYLGYPGSLGAEYVDYIVADNTLIPPSKQSYYSEKVAYLPDTYMVNDSKRKIPNLPLKRAEFNLPESGFVYCCFNNSFKITPFVFESWMGILKKVHGSVLWLSENNASFRSNLKKEALKQGIDPDRLVFANRVEDHGAHLARHRLADLFLDAKPYNAHTTAMDALQAGLPVLTQIGDSFTSRVAASLLNAIGLPELITHTQDEYEALAVELGINQNKITALKQKLINNQSTTALLNTKLFTRHIENAYQVMYERHQNGLAPDHIYIQSFTST